MSAPPVLAEHISKSYGALTAIRDVTLSVQEGEVVVFLGANGSGKSTLLQMLSTVLSPDSGRIVLFGGASPTMARRSIGLVFDHSSHWDNLTGYENAYFFGRSYGLGRAEARRRAEELLAWIGLGKKGDEPAGTYSYGMRRKLAIVEALVHEPSLLLMDEPSMGLDHISRLSLQEHLRGIARGGGAVAVTTNDVAEATVLADRVALLDKGRLLALASPEQLLRSVEAVTKVAIDYIPGRVPPDPLFRMEGVRAFTNEGRGPSEASLVLLLDHAQDVESVLSRVLELFAKGIGKVTGIEVRRPDLGDLMVRMASEG